MKVDFERFLASSALCAAFLVGCTVETTTSGIGSTATGTPSSSASSTSATSTGGAGGAGNDASSGTGGAPDDGGGDVSQPADGGGCFPDDGDAGVSPCSSLPYANVDCGGNDGGMDPPLGAFICTDLEGDLKLAAFRELYDCLKKVPGADGGATDACSMAHETAASACSVQLFSRTTCTVPNSPVDGGMAGCAQIVASCPGDGGTGGISLADCQRFLSPFDDDAREFIISCYFDSSGPQGTSCADKFENECVFPPQSR